MNLVTYVSVDGRPTVRFEREYRRPTPRVWRAVAEADQARQWFPSALTFESKVGGAVSSRRKVLVRRPPGRGVPGPGPRA